jgi:hypothetical protein
MITRIAATTPLLAAAHFTGASALDFPSWPRERGSARVEQLLEHGEFSGLGVHDALREPAHLRLGGPLYGDSGHGDAPAVMGDHELKVENLGIAAAEFAESG